MQFVSRLELQMFYSCHGIAGTCFLPMVVKLCVSGLLVSFVWRLDYQLLGRRVSRHVAKVLLHGDLQFWKPCFVSNPWQPLLASLMCWDPTGIFKDEMKNLSCCSICQTLPASQDSQLCNFSPSLVGTTVLTPQLCLAKTFHFLSLESPSCHISLPLDFLCGFRISSRCSMPYTTNYYRHISTVKLLSGEVTGTMLCF